MAHTVALAPREDLVKQIDLGNPTSIVLYGQDAQTRATEAADKLLAATKSTEAGVAGEMVTNMLLTLKGFSPKDEGGGGFLGFFRNAKRDMAKKLTQFETVKEQVEEIAEKMTERRAALLSDIGTIDTMLEDTLAWFHTLGELIAAGEMAEQRGAQEVEALRVEASKPNADVLAAQRANDRQTALNELERRVQDMRLTRQVVMQAIPALKLIQENDRALVGKIQSTLANTLPLWKQQMAIAVLNYRMGATGQMMKESADFTNAMLAANADMLRQGNTVVKQQIERGVFDIEVVVKANDTLIATLQDSERIAKEAKEARAKARVALIAAEEKIKEQLRPKASA